MTESKTANDYFDELKVVFVAHFKFLTRGLFVKRNHLRIGLMTGVHVTKQTKTNEYSTVCPILFFNFSNEEYSWCSKGNEPRDSYFFDIAGPRADRIERMLKQDFPAGFVSCHDPIHFQLILDKMYESFTHSRPRKKYRLPMFVEEFLAGIYEEHLLTLSSGKYEKIILSHADRIHRNLAGKHDFDANAAELGITSIHYRRLFKALIGVSPYEYLQQSRLHLAIDLLKTTKSIQIKQISERCGFSNATEFSRFFKQRTGVSPLNYCRKFFE